MIASRIPRPGLIGACAALTALAGAVVCAQTAPATRPAAEPSPSTLSAAAGAARPSDAANSAEVSTPSGSSFARQSDGPMPASYDMLTRKSIFSRDRAPRRERPVGAAFTAPVVRERPAPVLIGVLREDDGFVAFIEDPDTGRLNHFREGDRLPGTAGTIESISLNGLDIVAAAGQAPTHIGVGQNLLGAIPAPAAEPLGAASSAAPATTAGVTDTAATGSTTTTTTAPAAGGAEDIVERLKRLRRESLNK